MSAIIALATQVGLPLIEKILSRKVGASTATLATDILRNIAERAGTTPDGLDQLAEAEPGRVIEAMREVEKMSPELVALYAAGLEGQFALLQSERGEPLWVRAWRPLGMYGIGFLVGWNAVFLHVANAIWKIALPPTDWGVVIQICGLYMGLYMGGHTLKDIAGKWVQK